MLKYRNNDASAFESLYQRHKGSLYRYILRQCGNEAIAEELFHDVWIKLINARGRYKVKSRFTTWLYKMAHNRIIDHYRRQNTSFSKHHPDDDNLYIDSLSIRPQEQPEQLAELRQQSDKILQTLETLPLPQREVFLLKEEAGRTIQQIAEITGVSADTVKSRLRYAISKLRQAVREQV